jgi:cellulose synthase/poly-beta-1,6-N-acetylglucosamine synthase-like glycosyltransferase
MSAGQRRRFGALVLLWLAAGLSFLLWWLQGRHVVSGAGMALNTGVLFWIVFVQNGWYLFFVARMRRPNPACPLPEGPVAMVVTKAPSEPWPVVRRTLEGMLRQDFPRPYDVWLADEDPDDETRRWCAAHGVRLSCRKGVAGYHNRKCPRRARCKEGNLSYFYDRYGYEGYAFVAQLDADHVPEPGYLREIVRPFADPGVGYVAAPSICDANARDSWAARARLYDEATLHGPLQAGYAAGTAPLCIGSHYAVRTRALRGVGGLGPELAEDHSTTLLLSAAGWRGAFALDAVAHGDGPATLADFLTQEFQWSRSLVNILLNVTPRYWSRLPLRLKVHFAYCQLWYVGLAASMLLGYTLPVVALVTGVPWVKVDLPEFYLHAGILLLATLTAGEWVRRQGWARPQDAPLLSWEVALGNLLRWPWVALGIGYALLDTLLRREFAFRVTPKGVAGARPLRTAVLAPYLLLAAVEAGAALLVRDPGRAAGYYYLAVLYGATYVLAAGAAGVLHAREQGARLAAPAFRRTVRLVARPLALAVVAGTVTVAAGAARRDQTAAAILPPALRPPGAGPAAVAQDGRAGRVGQAGQDGMVVAEGVLARTGP